MIDGKHTDLIPVCHRDGDAPQPLQHARAQTPVGQLIVHDQAPHAPNIRWQRDPGRGGHGGSTVGGASGTGGWGRDAHNQTTSLRGTSGGA